MLVCALERDYELKSHLFVTSDFIHNFFLHNLIKFYKLDYSTRDTLLNIKLKTNYTFILKKDIDAVWTKKWDFEKWDKFEIIEIELKEEHDKSTHTVKFRVTNHKWKTREYDMSGWVFLKNFIDQIEQSDIIYKKIEILQDEVKSDVENITNKEEEKPKKWHEKIKDKLWKKKK